MNQKRLYMMIFVALAATGCTQKPAEQSPDGAVNAPTSAEAARVAAPAPVVDRGNVDFVELPLDGASNQAHRLKAAETIKGEFAATRDGAVSGVEVQIGNYGSSSAGVLKLKLCQAEQCTEGTADLAGSKDNEYFNIPLGSPLAVATSKGSVSYELTRESGENDFAVWSYPASVPTSKLIVDGADAADRTLKLGLRYNR